MVSAQGIDPQEEKIKSIQDWPVPKCVRDVRAFFGLAFYYRKFVKKLCQHRGTTFGTDQERDSL